MYTIIGESDDSLDIAYNALEKESRNGKNILRSIFRKFLRGYNELPCTTGLCLNPSGCSIQQLIAKEEAIKCLIRV